MISLARHRHQATSTRYNPGPEARSLMNFRPSSLAVVTGWGSLFCSGSGSETGFDPGLMFDLEFGTEIGSDSGSASAMSAAEMPKPMLRMK